MQYATLLATFLAAATAVGAVPALQQRTTACYQTQYYCPSTVDTLQCCNGDISAGQVKTGCSPYDNNSSRNPCDPSQIYCCGTETADAGTFCGDADVRKVQVSCT